MTLLTFFESGIHIALEVTDEGDTRLLHWSHQPYDPARIDGEKQVQWFRLVELQSTGEDQDDHHGIKYTGTLPAKRLRYVQTHDQRSTQGRLIEIELHDPKLNLVVM